MMTAMDSILHFIVTKMLEIAMLHMVMAKALLMVIGYACSLSMIRIRYELQKQLDPHLVESLRQRKRLKRKLRML